MLTALRIYSSLGALFFFVLLLLTYLPTQYLERSARGFVHYQIEQELKQLGETARGSSVVGAAKGLALKLGIEGVSLQQQLDNGIADRIASHLASLCGYDCERKKAIAHQVSASFLDRLKNIQVAQITLQEVIRDKYLHIVSQLRTDLRIFFVSNLMILAFIFALCWYKPEFLLQISVPALLLGLTTAIASYLYVFQQNWFYILLYDDYVGFGYLICVAIVFLLLLDLALNKARFSGEIWGWLLLLAGVSVSSAISSCVG